MSKAILKSICIFSSLSLLLVIYLAHIMNKDLSLETSKRIATDGLAGHLYLLNNIASLFEMEILMFDHKLLLNDKKCDIFQPLRECLYQNFTFAIEFVHIKRIGIENILNIINKAEFDVEVFSSQKMRLQMTHFGINVPVAIILKRTYTYVIHVLYAREDNVWWFGNFANDDQCLWKALKLSLSSSCARSELPEYVLNKFHFTEHRKFKDLSHILVPNDKEMFYNDIQHSKFIECNLTRALLFKKQYGEEKTAKSVRFKHKAWKILSKAKTILDFLSIPFWLSSGTSLGYFRQCDIIPHSKDVDIGILASDFNETIISHMEAQSLKLIHLFGYPNDSLELSFIDNGGVKLDIFFFYKENNYIWNGGTQMKTGKKFKYIFPIFDLCWTIFCGLKVRVPCQTEAYIVANYGNNWFKPVKHWDWKTSPNNVHPNGYWSR